MISVKNEKLAELQNKELEILHELDRVTKLCGINYYLSSGTCLGALRHKGFIPWDDDIDVYMYWQDAEKLLANSRLFKENYFLQCKKSDPNIKSTCYKLKDSNTCLITKKNIGLVANHGIGIDIYILYPYPDNKVSALLLLWLSFLYLILQSEEGPQNHGKFARFLGNLIYAIFKNKKEKIIKKIEYLYRVNGGKTYFATYFGRDISLFHSIKYPQDWFKNPAILKFEDLEIKCPGNVEEYCKLQYGETFMELPPLEKQKPHIDYIIMDTQNSYLKYKDSYLKKENL